MDFIRDLVALGWCDASEAAMTGQLWFRRPGRSVDDFVFDHVRIALYEEDMSMEHLHDLGRVRACREGTDMLDCIGSVEQGRHIVTENVVGGTGVHVHKEEKGDAERKGLFE